MTKITVDKALLESVLESHIKVLDTLRDWTNSDDFLWIQYSDETMQNEALTLREALTESAVEPEPIGEVVACNDHGHPWKRVSGYEWSLAELPIGTKVYASPPPPAEVPLLTPGEVALMWVSESFDTMSYESCYTRGVNRGEQVVRQKVML